MEECYICKNIAHYITIDGGWYICVSCIEETNKQKDKTMDNPNEPKNCPRCKQIYTGFPALSRLDNTSRICSPCGMDEAMQDFAGQPLTNFL